MRRSISRRVWVYADMAIETKQEDVVQLLKNCQFFEDFGEQELGVMTQFLDIRTGDRGDVLFFEGEQADALYVVGNGRVELLMNDGHDQARLVGWLGPSESFGELSLLLRGKRMVTVRATNPVVLFELSVPSFLRMRAHHPDVCLLLIMAIIKRFGRLVDSNQQIFKQVLLGQLNRV